VFYILPQMGIIMTKMFILPGQRTRFFRQTFKGD
jgi:hypothetical protein